MLPAFRMTATWTEKHIAGVETSRAQLCAKTLQMKSKAIFDVSRIASQDRTL